MAQTPPSNMSLIVVAINSQHKACVVMDVFVSTRILNVVSLLVSYLAHVSQIFSSTRVVM